MYLRGLVLLVYQPKEVLKKRDSVIRRRDVKGNNHLYLSELNLPLFSIIIRQFYRAHTLKFLDLTLTGEGPFYPEKAVEEVDFSFF